VSALCLALPGSAERVSHGAPDWTVDGRSFASLRVNHHGDGRVALVLALPDGRPSDLIAADPSIFHRPAYTRGDRWLGMSLNDLGAPSGADWNEVVGLVAEAWRAAAPVSLAARLDGLPDVPAPRPMTAEEIDPLRSPRGVELLEGLRRICLALPETSEASQFGAPSFRAGKKGFCTLHHQRARFALQVWVGEPGQAMLGADPRFRIPPYVGGNGWIELDVHDAVDRDEVAGLVLGSYRHYALKRMLKALDG
jgi:hypothetical protein